jgi:adenylate cyclase
MAPPSRRGQAWVRQLRLTTGLILFTFVTTHLLNHALGLVSLDAMEAGRWWFTGLWRSLPGTVLLYGAALTHIALAFWALYQRRHLRLPAADAWQLGLGLVLPVLLVSHVVGTRVSHELYGYRDSYSLVALALWELRPDIGARQVLVIALACIHGCLGLRASLRLRPWYPRASYALFGVALLLPVLAVLGFVEGGREAAARERAAGGPAVVQQAAGAPSPPGAAVLDTIRESALWTYGALLVGVVVGAGRTILAGAPARHGPSPVSGRARGPHRARLLRARGEPPRRDPARLRLRRARPLLDLPRARGPGRRGSRAPGRGGAARAPARGGAAQRAPRLSAPPDARRRRRSAPSATATAVAGGRRGVASGRSRRSRSCSPTSAASRFAERRLPYDVVFFLNRYFESSASPSSRWAASPTSSPATA